jgi:hypothetical protein
VRDQLHPFIVLNDRRPLVQLNFSSTNRRHPNIKKNSVKSRSTAVLIIFQSFISQDLDIWYDDETGGELSYQGFITPGETTSLTAYDRNIFIFTPQGDQKTIIKKYRINPTQVLTCPSLVSLISGRLGTSSATNRTKK